MALSAEDQARLDKVLALIGSGVKSATVGGNRSVEYDLDALREERDRLLALDSGVTPGSRFRSVTLTRDA